MAGFPALGSFSTKPETITCDACGNEFTKNTLIGGVYVPKHIVHTEKFSYECAEGASETLEVKIVKEGYDGPDFLAIRKRGPLKSYERASGIPKPYSEMTPAQWDEYNADYS